jgi:hypothetical protein
VRNAKANARYSGVAQERERSDENTEDMGKDAYLWRSAGTAHFGLVSGAGMVYIRQRNFSPTESQTIHCANRKRRGRPVCLTDGPSFDWYVGARMHKNNMARLLLAVALGLPLIACEDTKARQENEQLKARVAELVKESGDLGNRVDALTQENTELKQENERLKAKKTHTKSSKSKHHRHTTKPAASTAN